MTRVAVTGLGIVSCLGNDKASVAASLREGRSGIRHVQEYADLGLRSHIAGTPEIDLVALVDRKIKRFMGDAAAYAYVAMQDAIDDAGLKPEDVSNPRTGIIVGSGGGSVANQVDMADTLRSRGVRRVGPYMVPRTMCSTVSAGLATPFRIKGINYSISSACATSAHCIGAAVEQIKLGKQDVVFAGGAEEVHWGMTGMFDAMGALSARRNDVPAEASRPFDTDRDGFVIAGGAGILVLEELDHAVRRGAKIYAELAGYGASSDGYDMVTPSGEGAMRCMQMALGTVDGQVDYINAHGTATPAGDAVELRAIREVFGRQAPPISSTKSMSGHSLGAAGAHEAIYSLLMMEGDFIAPSINIDTLDADAQGLAIVREAREAELQRVMSNSFGFGGTNASLVFQRFDG
ncbi:MAG TPA: beta-ketoacyl-ACP synthase I [Steroidobacteraceae bacterium]|nr:beta-ketoacyl-ACP synthase I [Steroidobacteraceae bacterium]